MIWYHLFQECKGKLPAIANPVRIAFVGLEKKNIINFISRVLFFLYDLIHKLRQMFRGSSNQH